VTDSARPEDAGPQREVDALSGLPDDSRVHIDDIEWPDLDWSDSDVPAPAPTPPPVVLRLVAPAPEPNAEEAEPEPPPAELPPPGPTFQRKEGADWRPAVPFWLRMPEPEVEPEPEPESEEPRDWRPAVPFWLRMPEPEPVDESSGPDVEAEAATHDATPEPSAPVSPVEPELADEHAPPHELEPIPVEAALDDGPEDEPLVPAVAEPVAPVDELDELPPDEDLTPLPGTTGEAVFFPPSSRRTFAAPTPPSAPNPESAPSADAPEPGRPAAGSSRPEEARPRPAARTPLTRPADPAFAQPVAPYAQYDSPNASWDRIQTNATWAGTDPSREPERHVPQSTPEREPRLAPAHRRWLIRGAVIGSIVGGLLVSLVIILATQGRFNSISGTITGAPTGTPDEVVVGYLNALAHSDSQQALGFAKLRPTDQRMLTDEVLTASNKLAPLRQITVHTTELTDYRAQVDAAYLIGDQKVAQSFTVYAVGTEWKLYDVARKVDLGQLKTGDLPLSLNGITIPAENVELFPGRYQVATTDERYLFTKDTFLVSSPTVPPDLGEVQLGLSSSGVEQIAAAASSRLDGCLAAHELQPAGCGFGAVAPKGTVVRPETLHWKATKGLESLQMMRPTLDPDNPRLATADVLIQVSVTAKDTKGRDWAVADSIKSVLAGLGDTGIEITLD